MNVLLVVPWDQASGGVASVVASLARHLQESGDHVVFLHPGPTARLRERRTVSGFSGHGLILRAPIVQTAALKSFVGFIVNLAPTLLQLALLIRKHAIQIVNIHYPTEPFVYFGILRWLLPIRLVVSVHGADLFPGGRRMERYPWPLALILRSSDAVVAPSRAFLADSITVFPGALNKGYAIHNGVDIDAFAARADVTSARPYILCIAAHNEKKALDVLLDGFAQIRQKYSSIDLVLVGDGPLRRELEACAESLGLKGRVVFAGEKSRSEVVRLLKGCSFLVLPSRAEPFGMVLTEAMASRRAVIATRVGGVGEIVEDGKSGILVDPDNSPALAGAMAMLLDNSSLRDALAEAGYQRVRARFSFRRMGERYKELFVSLLEETRPVPDRDPGLH